MTVIVANGLTKIFHDPRRGGEFRAVDDVSLTCHPGRIFGLLGPNGAGKTTTLAHPFDHPAVPTARQQRQRSAGWTSLTDRRPGRASSSSVSAPARRASTSVITSRRDDPATSAACTGLDGRRRRTPRRASCSTCSTCTSSPNTPERASLSAGMRQKVSLARTIVHDPPVLIFDEPTTSASTSSWRAPSRSSSPPAASAARR